MNELSEYESEFNNTSVTPLAELSTVPSANTWTVYFLLYSIGVYV